MEMEEQARRHLSTNGTSPPLNASYLNLASRYWASVESQLYGLKK